MANGQRLLRKHVSGIISSLGILIVFVVLLSNVDMGGGRNGPAEWRLAEKASAFKEAMMECNQRNSINMLEFEQKAFLEDLRRSQSIDSLAFQQALSFQKLRMQQWL